MHEKCKNGEADAVLEEMKHLSELSTRTPRPPVQVEKDSFGENYDEMDGVFVLWMLHVFIKVMQVLVCLAPKRLQVFMTVMQGDIKHFQKETYGFSLHVQSVI